MRDEERSTLMRQRELFDEYRETLESEFPGAVVGFVEGQRIIAPTVEGLLDRASVASSPIYFEPVPDLGPVGPSLSASTTERVRSCSRVNGVRSGQDDCEAENENLQPVRHLNLTGDTRRTRQTCGKKGEMRRSFAADRVRNVYAVTGTAQLKSPAEQQARPAQRTARVNHVDARYPPHQSQTRISSNR